MKCRRIRKNRITRTSTHRSNTWGTRRRDVWGNKGYKQWEQYGKRKTNKETTWKSRKRTDTIKQRKFLRTNPQLPSNSFLMHVCTYLKPWKHPSISVWKNERNFELWQLNWIYQIKNMLARKSKLKSCIKLLQVDSCQDFDMGMHSQSFLSPEEWVRQRTI